MFSFPERRDLHGSDGSVMNKGSVAKPGESREEESGAEVRDTMLFDRIVARLSSRVADDGSGRTRPEEDVELAPAGPLPSIPHASSGLAAGSSGPWGERASRGTLRSNSEDEQSARWESQSVGVRNLAGNVHDAEVQESRPILSQGGAKNAADGASPLSFLVNPAGSAGDRADVSRPGEVIDPPGPTIGLPRYLRGEDVTTEAAAASRLNGEPASSRLKGYEKASIQAIPHPMADRFVLGPASSIEASVAASLSGPEAENEFVVRDIVPSFRNLIGSAGPSKGAALPPGMESDQADMAVRWADPDSLAGPRRGRVGGEGHDRPVDPPASRGSGTRVIGVEVPKGGAAANTVVSSFAITPGIPSDYLVFDPRTQLFDIPPPDASISGIPAGTVTVTAPGPSGMVASAGYSPPPPPIAQQIGDVARTLSSDETILRLDPEELGRVSLGLRGDERSLTLVIQAERPETAELIRRNIEDLTRELMDLGYESIGFEFGESHPNRHTPDEERERPFVLTEEEIAPSDRPTARSVPGTVGHVDIRL